MKPSFLLGVFVGYVLGTRAGRERYEDLVALARRVAGSQTIQSTAGVLQAQAAEVASRAKDRLAAKVPLIHASQKPATAGTAVNGHRPL
ncbi:MAG: hypothetical protein QOK10_1433 [Pseudonocardiales bacterium]|jgi:hypothetical protein|nr:hypothetical protein [Pseudonocardiales bacterium]